MDIEYLEYEIIELPELGCETTEGAAREAEMIYLSWFTDWQGRVSGQSTWRS